MFSYRTLRASATLDIVLRSEAQRQWHLPFQQHYLLVCSLFLSPMPRGRSKDFCGLSDSPRNSHRKCIHRSSCHGQQHPVRRRFVPFHSVTTAFQHSHPAWLVLWPIPDLDGGSCFSQSGPSMFRVIFPAVPVLVPSCCSSTVWA